jgi:predicted nucleic acid-binding protein
VLTSYYQHAPADAARVVSALVTADGVVLEDGMQVVAALRDTATRNVDFADAYLAAKARLGRLPVCSFDSDFRRLDVDCVRPGAAGSSA